MHIKQIQGREILDSHGYPTIECTITLDTHHTVTSSVPSGTSIGKYEAHELRDHDPKRFNGNGVLKAITAIEKVIAPLLIGQAPDLGNADALMIASDNTPQKTTLGANTMLAVSIAVARAQAYTLKCEVYELLSQLFLVPAPQLPLCMFNILNGGLHANNKLPFQEFMIMPRHQPNMQNTVHTVTLIYHELKKLLNNKGYLTTVGDEGGFAPRFMGTGINKNRIALDFIMQAIEKAGFGQDQIAICLDVAASHFYDAETKLYRLEDDYLEQEALIELYSQLANEYPLFAIEDGMGQDDWDGWHALTKHLGNKIHLIGDDLFVTNTEKITQGLKEQSANGVIIKPNQIGTISEAVKALKLAQQSNFITVASHRSNETNDSFIADFAVGMATGYLKAGAVARGERVAKYNRLMEIALHKPFKK